MCCASGTKVEGYGDCAANVLRVSPYSSLDPIRPDLAGWGFYLVVRCRSDGVSALIEELSASASRFSVSVADEPVWVLP